MKRDVVIALICAGVAVVLLILAAESIAHHVIEQIVSALNLFF
jgi:hypothetical protein